MPAAITLVTLGEFDPASVTALQELVTIHHTPAKLDADADCFVHGAAINAAVDASPHDWVLLLRSGESIDAALSRELLAAMDEPAKAWGFRVRSSIVYDGVPLRSPAAERAEIRLYHRRHARFDPRRRTPEIKVQGSIVRLHGAIERMLSSRDHLAALARTGVPHSKLRHVLLFLRALLRAGIFVHPRLRRYLWIETAFDQSRAGFPDRYSAS